MDNSIIPKVSVIVPVYNVEKYIHQCLDSIVNQTYKNFELLLIDDGSPDNCSQICDEYAKNDSRIKVIHKKNEGLMAAWIDGLKIAQAEWIMFVDSDDWIDLNMIEVMAEKTKIENIDIITANMVKVLLGKVNYREHYFEPGIYSESEIQKIMYPQMINNGKFQGRGVSVSRCGNFIKKKLLSENIHYCDKNIFFGEDLNIMFPIYLDCKKMCLLPNDITYYYYRNNQKSILHSYNKTMYKQVQDLYKILFRVSQEKNVYDFEKQLLADYLSAIVQSFKNELLNKNSRMQNICKMMEDERFILGVKNTNIDRYSILNKIIIKSMYKKCKIFLFLIIPMLSFLKKIKWH